MVTKKLPGSIKNRRQYSPARMLEHLFHRHAVKDCHNSYDTERAHSHRAEEFMLASTSFSILLWIIRNTF